MGATPMATYEPLVGDLTPDRLRAWAAAQAGRPNVGPARALIRQYLTGHATIDQVLAAVAEYERLSEQRECRQTRQVWVSPNLPLADGQLVTDLRVWQPGRGDFTLPAARFVAAAPRGAALYHVMVREVGSDYSRKIGSLVEA